MILDFLKSGYRKVKSALDHSKAALGSRLRGLFGGTIDDETFEDLEQMLYEADLGVGLTTQLVQKIQSQHLKDPSLKGEDLLHLLAEDVSMLMKEEGIASREIKFAEEGPTVILIVGVNGNGKTTTIAKLAKKFQSQGKKVLLGAGDTFRAAAIDQLEMWANRIGVEIIKSKPGSDPAAVAFDTLEAAKARQADVVLVDTAGRLHSKKPLMQELEKIRRSCGKVLPGTPHEVLLVLDATIGQNGIDQAKTFNQFTPLTGIVLTKLDGTAKGGIVLAIQNELKIPVKFIGIGEGMDDLEPFNPESYVSALFE